MTDPGPCDPPYVCPGCHAVGGEPCAADCVDARLEREREESDEEDYEPLDINDSDDWEWAP
jgi:hypothetical protein